MTEPTTRRPYRLERKAYHGGKWRCSATYTTLEAAMAVGARDERWWRGGWRVVDARTGAVVHDASTKGVMSDWTTSRVVRDRDGDMWGRTDSDWTMLPVAWGSSGHANSAAELLADFGPLVPVLDADGLPVVRTVGDLTARHIGRRVRVETDRTLPDRVRLLREIATASSEKARLTLEVIDHPEWFLMAWFDHDTPCEVIG